MVASILDKLEVDTMVLTDLLLEQIDTPEATSTLSPSYQIYLTPDLAQILENGAKVAADLKDEFISTEHLFVAIFDVPGQSRDILARFRINRENVIAVIEELKTNQIGDAKEPKRMRV